MKRTLLAVCSLLLAVGLVGCASEERGDDGLPLGEMQQDLALEAPAAPFAASSDQQAEDTPDRPEPEPWRSAATTANGAVVPGPGPGPDSDPRRFAADGVRAAGGEDRPEPEPWQPKDTSVSMTKNQ